MTDVRETFNHDLLLHEADRQVAQRRYPTIWHVLDHPELRAYFADWTVLHDYEGQPTESGHQHAVAELVARKA